MPDQTHGVRYTWASERHLRIHFSDADSKHAQARIQQIANALQSSPPDGLIEITPACATIVIQFELAGLDEKRALTHVQQIVERVPQTPLPPPGPLIEIPACYEPPWAPDAEEVAAMRGITLDDLIRLHCQQEYTVQFIGFAPGFAYLGTLPGQLVTQRLATPRIRIPIGSIGIAGQYTGIYPHATAGGWRLIARTPLIMFDASLEKPSLLAANDRVRFVPITLTEFNAQSLGQVRP